MSTVRLKIDVAGTIGDKAWREIKLQTPLLAQYAVSHYLEQERVLDADVID